MLLSSIYWDAPDRPWSASVLGGRSGAEPAFVLIARVQGTGSPERFFVLGGRPPDLGV